MVWDVLLFKIQNKKLRKLNVWETVFCYQKIPESLWCCLCCVFRKYFKSFPGVLRAVLNARTFQSPPPHPRPCRISASQSSRLTLIYSVISCTENCAQTTNDFNKFLCVSSNTKEKLPQSQDCIISCYTVQLPQWEAGSCGFLFMLLSSPSALRMSSVLTTPTRSSVHSFSIPQLNEGYYYNYPHFTDLKNEA